ncbi:hypothetical protein AG1IA_01889 [Rhizoctonia solani AG-1 IA]|uniref:Uncharacterized protein n=1 Tax=Thanatephorus cucumeris (strain AG1-IA) TaxID=983506 RepID=L8X4P4_THACA|nr:hypothetical protein AG1IA_01889 [Rhizoctonia solani AG-1 IA]
MASWMPICSMYPFLAFPRRSPSWEQSTLHCSRGEFLAV